MMEEFPKVFELLMIEELQQFFLVSVIFWIRLCCMDINPLSLFYCYLSSHVCFSFQFPTGGATAVRLK